MKLEEINETLIGRKVKGIENGYEVTGTIIGIVEEEFSKGVRIKLDEPLTCWSGDFNTDTWVEEEYVSTGRKCDGWGNIEHTEFLDGVESLKNYKPKDRHITSWGEYKYIAHKLSLYDSTPEHVIEMRNRVVKFFGDLIEGSKEAEERDNYGQALMSITAVVDDFKWKMGIEI